MKLQAIAVTQQKFSLATAENALLRWLTGIGIPHSGCVFLKTVNAETALGQPQ